MKIHVRMINYCANNVEGFNMLVKNGKISKKINFNYVPYVLINGIPHHVTKNFTKEVCAAFQHPPEACKKILYL